MGVPTESMPAARRPAGPAEMPGAEEVLPEPAPDRAGRLARRETAPRETIVVLDFGSQYTQLIARRLRELGVFCEILPCTTSAEAVWGRNPLGVVLSGGPESVYGEDAPAPPPGLFGSLAGSRAPLLGVCYGMQLLARASGGDVRPAPGGSYGPVELEQTGDGRLFSGVPPRFRVWASHGDRVHALPAGFRRTAGTAPAAIAAFESPERNLYGVQFHPEVVHTEHGLDILRNFAFGICGATGGWSPKSHAERAVEAIRAEVGDSRVVCGASGGVDSTVTAMLLHRAVPDRLHCIFVDNGLLRQDEASRVRRAFEDGLGIPLRVVDASARFLDRLAGALDPERKRKIIGREFIRVFEEAAREIPGVRFLAQGTLYPDVIESAPVKGPSAVIKSHHNVGGLPERMQLALVEPLRELFKDEVRILGRELGAPEDLVGRHPFPGPGLAVRILGPVEEASLSLLRKADAILEEEIRAAGYYDRVWQAFSVLLPLRTVGVMGDARTYERVIALRVVESLDGMTADWAPLPSGLLARVSNRITGEVRGVNRVVLDITSKPPSTIEWE